MSESQMTMKFELLPNELVIECFEFLDIFDIFYSFNHLNNHFNQLIRTIPLHLHFQHSQKSLFDKICQFLLVNSDVKNQVYSLELSNKNTCGQIDAFLSIFSLDEFSRLQSLTLTEVKNENIGKLKSILPLIPQLSSFHLIDSDDIILILKNLTLYHATIKESCEYYFPNVNSLTILPSEQYYKPNLGAQAIKSLKQIINLLNLKYLNISLKFRIKDSYVFLKILGESPQLSSIRISVRALEQFFYNSNLCECLNKMIKTLDIYKYASSSFKYRYQLEEFCKVFSNLEELKCNIDQAKDLLYLLNHLPKLSILKAYLWSIKDHEYFHSWFKKETRKLNLLFHMNYIDKRETELFVWIGRNIN